MITSLPWLLVLALVVGVAQALYLKSRRPDIYDGLNSDLERFDDHLATDPAIG